MCLPGSDTGGGTTADVFPLHLGDSLLLVTDGVTEARESTGAFHDPCRHLDPGHYGNPRRLLDALVCHVFRWTGGRTQDDMAIVALTRAIPMAHWLHVLSEAITQCDGAPISIDRPEQ
ncbi:SpoIIE family protein phosphatase [Streptomyces spiralis]